MQKEQSEGFFKKDFMRIFADFAKKHLWVCYFIKIESVKQVFLGENCSNTFFAGHHRATASDCSNSNINEGRIG